MDNKTKHKPYTLNILWRTPGLENVEIKGSKLPRHKQVLISLLANIKKIQLAQSGNPVIKNLKNDAMKEVIRQIVDFYKRAGIPLVSEKLIMYRLNDLYKKYDQLRKRGKSRLRLIIYK